MSNPIQNSTASNPTPPEGGNSSYSPSVPISLYREVTAELQGSQNLINSLRTQNQQLLEENQNLRQELNHVVQAANQFYLAVESVQGKNQIPSMGVPPVNPSFSVNPVSPPPNFYEQPTTETPQPDLVFPPTSDGPDIPPPQFTEEPEGRLRPASRPDRGELSGVWLIVSIALIVVAAFGMGYWVVRPLLQQQGR
ncbi:MAG: hypothetical protein P5702_03415 [Limnospira sp. PMC 1291.21]|uniref:hypothetical protein n=1 Tax=unclassified Limnospira TaxID=2642885 RepID=UPI0028E16991|nr:MULTISPECIES: hypothetical protein [unclassified Limnospira]MDT9176489.1 hypothetical protein [Limnospira sp. PMC 1238.20]MDT9191850.1 hypothetical protein [Limnospira sp. PMC 1245.20]MDT9202091.1 hypothetical protein [Limnospira sp. PMC 1243.20]MDT9207239.1 hypothetical protein [Limnospira sp. PMC 1252.20]MDT9212510.1 hypothetical protein [Limnospira sp. PMC 1256.20]